jgi:hypothetical protein
VSDRLAAAGLLAAILGAPTLLVAAEPPPPSAATPPSTAPPATAPPAATPAPVAPAPVAPPPSASPAPREAAPSVPPEAPAAPPAPASEVAPPEVTEPVAAPAPPPGTVPTPSAGAEKPPASSPPQPYKSPHGLFFQAALGAGALLGSNGVSSDTRSFSGVAVSWNLLFGGTMQRRWAGGAGISREHVPAPKSHDEVIDGDEPNLEQVSFALDTLVAFVDFHPYQDGFHALGQLGLGSFSADRGTGIQSVRGPTWVVALGAGYDVKLPGSLSVGGLAQLTYTRQEMWEGQRRVDLDLLFPSLLLTAAYR